MTAAELKATIERHGLWLKGDPSGSRADLSGANLTGAYLSGADLTRAYLSGANLTGADLTRANLTGADLSGANLTRAYLSGADLTRAYLSGANLTGADLTRANLTGANLTGAKNFESTLVCNLYLLLDQPGPIRAYKLVNEAGVGPFNGGLKYEVGGQYEVTNANTDPNEGCGAGIHVATLPWVMREWRKGYKVLLVEFWADDIACIPLGTDGKFRLHRCRVVGEKDVTKQIAALAGGAA